jgi:hypothetical protein
MVQHTPLAAPDFAAWNAALLRVLTAAPPAIAEALDAALRLVLDFDVILIAALHREAPPSVPYYGGAQEPSPAYHDGPYLLDPFYNRFLAGTTDGCFRLSELAPEGFLRSEYFSSYYRHLEIGDELGLLTVLGAGSAAHVSITRRRGRPRFTRRDHDWLAATGPLVREAVRRMNEVQSPVANDRSARYDAPGLSPFRRVRPTDGSGRGAPALRGPRRKDRARLNTRPRSQLHRGHPAWSPAGRAAASTAALEQAELAVAHPRAAALTDLG